MLLSFLAYIFQFPYESVLIVKEELLIKMYIWSTLEHKTKTTLILDNS